MPRYHFTAIVDTEVAKTEEARDFETLCAARDGARAALARIAAARLSQKDCEFISVEVFDENDVPITELRL